MKIIVLALLCGVSLAGECIVGEWGPWTDWVSPSCSHDDTRYTSFPQDSQPLVDQGGINREFMMEHKKALHEKTVECRENGICSKLEGETRKARADCVGGTANGYPCNNIHFLAQITAADLCNDHCIIPGPQVEAADIWGWYDAASGREFAIVTIVIGTSFVEVTDPENPSVLAYLPGTGGLSSDWRDAKVIGNYVYIGSEAPDHGLQIYDLTNLLNYNPGEATVQVENTAFFGGFGSSHNIVASESSNTIFAVGSNACSAGLYAVDVSDPLNPAQSGCFGDDGYVHDAQCVVYNGPDVAYNGSEICFSFNEDTLTIVDVTNKGAMVQISRTSYNGFQYTHQGWVTEDHQYLLLDDELDEFYDTVDQSQRTHIWDITSLTTPVLVNTYTANFFSIDHNQYILGDYTYQANYQAGLRLLSILSGPALAELAYFDVHPDDDIAEFNGMWSVYPYLPSGNMICSSIERGLFILEIDWPAVKALKESEETYRERRRFRNVLEADEDSSCPILVGVEQFLVPATC